MTCALVKPLDIKENFVTSCNYKTIVESASFKIRLGVLKLKLPSSIMPFFDWSRSHSSTSNAFQTALALGTIGQEILETISRLGGEVSLGLLKDETGLSYAALGQELKQLKRASLIKSGFSLAEGEANPFLVYRLH